MFHRPGKQPLATLSIALVFSALLLSAGAGATETATGEDTDAPADSSTPALIPVEPRGRPIDPTPVPGSLPTATHIPLGDPVVTEPPPPSDIIEPAEEADPAEGDTSSPLDEESPPDSSAEATADSSAAPSPEQPEPAESTAADDPEAHREADTASAPPEPDQAEEPGETPRENTESEAETSDDAGSASEPGKPDSPDADSPASDNGNPGQDDASGDETSARADAGQLVDDSDAADENAPADADVPEPAEDGKDVSGHLFLLGVDVPPGTSTRLAWAPKQSFEGIYIATPVLVVNGREPGPTLCLTAAIHGDELNGIETVRRVLYNLEPDRLKGAVIGVPIVNLQGFHASSRYLSDRRDLNRYFPGDPGGSSASRIAHSFFHEVITHCSAVVDLHTGSFYRTNLPQLRGDLSKPEIVDLTRGFGSTVVLHGEGSEGTLRRAATDAGIPAVTLEAGGPSVLEESAVGHSVKGIRTLLNHLGMTSRFSLWGDPEPVYYNSVWERAPVGGIVFSRVSLGQNVREGEVLGTVTNPITNVRTRIISKHTGRVIGMALNQVVQPGFATHHIGIAAPRGRVPVDLPVPVDDASAAPPATDNGNRPQAPENGSHDPLSADDESDEGGPLSDD